MTAGPDLHSSGTMTELVERLADDVQKEIAAIIADKGHCVLALAGGKTPVPFFHALAKRKIEWDDVTITLTDERYVPPDHTESNEGMLRRELLTGPVSKAQFIGLYAPAETAEASLAKLNPPATLDIIVAGMGDDMHTLSWFPGAAGLIPALSTSMGHRLVVVRPGVQVPRISFAAKAVGEAKFIHLLIAGKAKKMALEAALEAPFIEQAPVKRLFAYQTAKTNIYWAETSP
jgi:6-phosphogluconolactonase